MNVFSKPILAIAFGAFLVCAETCRHFDALLSLPEHWASLPIHDWIAGAYLVYAGVRSRRPGRPAAGPHLLAAWAFNLSLLCGALLGHLEDWSSQAPSDRLEFALIGAIALLFLIALGGLVSALDTVRR